MGWYRDQILPRVVNKAMDTKVEREIRPRVCSGLHGQVVELGFGTGLNTAHYPSEVAKVWAIEPSTVSMRLAEQRLAACATPVELGGLTGEHLDLPSEEFDAVLSTWTLCTIPNLGAALDETRRVLKADGVFHFVEHGHSPDPGVAHWQERLEPLQKRVFGGCHLSRKIDEHIERAGFVIEQLETYYTKGAPKPFTYTFEGRARKR